MLKGKFFPDRNGVFQFEGEMTIEDYCSFIQKERNQTETPSKQNEHKTISNIPAIPLTPIIKGFVQQLPPKERTPSVVSKHFFGRILSAKPRRIYGLFYARFQRAKRQVEREEKLG